VFNELLQDIKRYKKKGQLINQITRKCWETFKNPEQREKYRGFITCSSWLCFLANEVTQTNSNGEGGSEKIEDKELKPFINKINDILTFKELNKEEEGLQEGFIKAFRDAIGENTKDEKDKSLFKLLDFENNPPSDSAIRKAYRDLYDSEDIKRKNVERSPVAYLPISSSYIILEKFNSILEKSKKQVQNQDLTVCGLSAIEFHQTIHYLFIIACKYDGIFSDEEILNNLKSEKFKNIKDSLEKLRKVIKVLSWEKRELNREFKKLSAYLDKHSNPTYDLNPFYKKPIFTNKINGTTKYIIPSPYIFLFITKWIYWRDIDKNKFNNEIGKAYETYIGELLNYYKEQLPEIKNIKSLDGLENNSAKADFIVRTANYLFILECKNSLGLRSTIDKSSDNQTTLVKVLARISKAFQQCSHTKKLIIEKKTSEFKEWAEEKIYSLVIVNEDVLAEATILFAFYPEFSKQLEFKWGEFGILSCGEFETLVSSGNLENHAKICEENSKELLSKSDTSLEVKDILKALNLMSDKIFEYTSNSTFWEQYNKILDGFVTDPAKGLS
jgi:hypothetical protein